MVIKTHFSIKIWYCQYIDKSFRRKIAMPYYRRIRELREDHDFSQRKVAEILKMKQPQYFRYEQGFRDIPTDILISLSDLYNVSIDYLLGRTDNPVISR